MISFDANILLYCFSRASRDGFDSVVQVTVVIPGRRLGEPGRPRRFGPADYFPPAISRRTLPITSLITSSLKSSWLNP